MAQKYCTECGARLIENSRFCPECGSLILSERNNNPPAGFAAPVGFAQFNNTPAKMGKLSPADNSLTMLAEYCRKTVATVGGDGYTEWVLNRCENGTLQLDYYRNYMGYEEEVHEIHPAPADTWDRITSIKEQYNLQNPPAERNLGMCGGETIIKIREGDSVIRLTYGALTVEENEAFSKIRNILVAIADNTQ